MSAITDLKDQFDAKLQEVIQASTDEHTQVMDAIKALQDQLVTDAGGIGTQEDLDAFKASMNSGFDSLKSAVAAVFEPAATTAAPAPTTDHGTVIPPAPNMGVPVPSTAADQPHP